MLLFYDSMVYYVGGRRGKKVKINTEEDIHQLNLLQIINCDSTLFGNESMTESYFNFLAERSKKFSRAREPFEIKYQTGPNTFVAAHGESSCKIDMALSFVAFSTHAERFRDSGQLRYGRPFALDAIDAFQNDPRFQDNSN
jgi:hypothetical protein